MFDSAVQGDVQVPAPTHRGSHFVSTGAWGLTLISGQCKDEGANQGIGKVWLRNTGTDTGTGEGANGV